MMKPPVCVIIARQRELLAGRLCWRPCEAFLFTGTLWLSAVT